MDLAWHGEIAEQNPAVYAVIDAAGISHGAGMKSYLIMMAVRLLEMRRLLKPTGSLYLHCDPTASAYLKLLLDAVFGSGNFRNEIVWSERVVTATARKGGNSTGVSATVCCSTHGALSDMEFAVHAVRATYVDRAYRHVEPNTGAIPLGRFNRAGREAKGNPSYAVLGVTRFWRYSEPRMQRLIEAGRVVQTKPGSVPRTSGTSTKCRASRFKIYGSTSGRSVRLLKERVGYPTQKPLALLDRSSRWSSNAGDVVLDPFAGCATACVSA